MNSSNVTVWLVCSRDEMFEEIGAVFSRLPHGAWTLRRWPQSSQLSPEKLLEIGESDIVLVDLQTESLSISAASSSASTCRWPDESETIHGGLQWLCWALDFDCRAALVVVSRGAGEMRDGTPWDVASIEAGATDFLNLSDLTPEFLERVLRYASERAKVSGALARRDAIRQAVSYAAQQFLSSVHWQDTISEVLERMGRAAQVSRVYLYEFDAAPDAELLAPEMCAPNSQVLRLRYEWTTVGVSRLMDVPLMRYLNLNIGEFMRYMPLVTRGETMQFQTRDFPNPEHDYLLALGIRSWIVVPIMVGGAFWGYIGFDETRFERTWNRFELDALRMAADILAAAIEHGRVEDEREQAENALRESKRFNEEVISSANEGITVHDRQLKYLLWNGFMERLTGVGAADVLGKSADDIFSCDDLPALAELMKRALQGESTQTGDLEFEVGQNGRKGWISCSFEPHRNAHNEIIGIIGVVRDVGEARQAAEQLRRSEEKFRSLIENGQDIICVFDGEGTISYASPSLERVLGYKPSNLVGSPMWNLLHGDDATRVREHTFNLQNTTGATASFEMRLRHFNGAWRTFEATGANLLHDAAVNGIVVNARDISQRKHAEEALIRAAMHDRLTALPNRALFMDRLRLRLERARRAKESLFAVLFLDFDRFKVINDSLGHMAGDQLLVSIARRLEGCLRPGDTVARLGGDEFAILLEDILNTGDAVFVAERVQKEMRRPFTLGRDDGTGARSNHEIFTAASIGIAIAGNPPQATSYERPEDLLRDADMAMYRAKERGRARHEIFNAGMHEHAVTRLQLETDLRAAIERGEFEVHYQPILALEHGTLNGFEALVRWNHPTRGIISPGEFLGVAEETGLIAPLGWWVLRQSCLQLRLWLDALNSNDQTSLDGLTINVNLSGRQFMHADLINRIETSLGESGLRPNNLRLEVTESVLMNNPDTAARQLENLRGIGVHLGIDDFGTGYSNLSYLHRFPINTLKIDRSFVSHLNEAHNTAIVRSIIVLAQQLNLEVVAEGVETASQLEHLKELDCRLGQGYLFSRPLDHIAAATFLTQRPTWPHKPISEK